MDCQVPILVTQPVWEEGGREQLRSPIGGALTRPRWARKEGERRRGKGGQARGGGETCQNFPEQKMRANRKRDLRQ